MSAVLANLFRGFRFWFFKSYRKAMNRNWGNQKPYPTLKTKTILICENCFCYLDKQLTDMSTAPSLLLDTSNLHVQGLDLNMFVVASVVRSHTLHYNQTKETNPSNDRQLKSFSLRSNSSKQNPLSLSPFDY